MILIIGVKHSYTSAVAKFLHDNGAKYMRIDHNRTSLLDWNKYEDKEVRQWLNDRRSGKRSDFPMKYGIVKMPETLFFLDEIPKHVKLIYCVRNPRDLIHSHMDKYKRGFFRIFSRYVSGWDIVANAEQETFTLFTEQLLNRNKHTAKQLLNYCGLKCSEIEWHIDKPKIKKRTYRDWRVRDLILKKLWFLLK